MNGANFDKYMLRGFCLVCMVIATAVMLKAGPEFPVFGIKFAIASFASALAAYLTGFLGVLSYMTARTRVVDDALGAQALTNFTNALAEPMQWSVWTVFLTVSYFACTMTVLPWLAAGVFVAAVSVTITTAFATLRNFHLIRMFLMTTLKAVMVQQGVKETLMNQIQERIEQALEDHDCPGCQCELPPPPPTDTIQ